MNPFWHPRLAALWLLVTLCTAALSCITRKENTPYAWYFRLCLAENCYQWVCSLGALWWWNYWGFWWFNFAAHGLIVLAALNFGFDIGKRLKRLPESFPFMATAVMVTIISTGLLAACWRDGGVSQSQVLWADHAVQMGTCGLLALVLLLASFGGVVRDGKLRKFLEGACMLYAFGVIAAGLRVYRPVDREVGWCMDMIAQLAACGYWIKAMWNNSSTGGNQRIWYRCGKSSGRTSTGE